MLSYIVFNFSWIDLGVLAFVLLVEAGILYFLVRPLARNLAKGLEEEYERQNYMYKMLMAVSVFSIAVVVIYLISGMAVSPT